MDTDSWHIWFLNGKGKGLLSQGKFRCEAFLSGLVELCIFADTLYVSADDINIHM